ncbi:hypothetical protein TNCV_4565871 [Trichonephila clavipes]|nr:hypothetical protein TNCV_4565871 [Trichonephila clavipes]
MLLLLWSSVRELMRSQQSRSFSWKSIQDRTIRCLCSKASHPSFIVYPADREVTSAVPEPIFGCKYHRTRCGKDQWPNSNPDCVQTEVFQRHVLLEKT